MDHEIPRRDVTTTDELLIANGKVITLRWITEDGKPAGGIVYVGGNQVGIYKTAKGVNTRARRELAGFTPPHARQPVRWAFDGGAVPAPGTRHVAVTAEVTTYGDPDQRGELRGTYEGMGRRDGVTVHVFTDVLLNNHGLRELGEIALPDEQRVASLPAH